MSMFLLHHFDSLRQDLSGKGLNLCALLSAQTVKNHLPSAQLPKSCESLLVLASAGNQLWDAMPEEYLQRPDPVDDYTRDCVALVLGQQLPDSRWSVLYPGSIHEQNQVSLQQLGKLVGWHHDSPLGIGINAKTGLWFAYRAVVALDQLTADEGVLLGSIEADSAPCISCVGTPCISSCPATALTENQTPNLTACINYRLEEQSNCVSRCVARQACPVGIDWRYTDQQQAYFYQRSLKSVRKWVKQKGVPHESD